jgi:hypothetical protein
MVFECSLICYRWLHLLCLPACCSWGSFEWNGKYSDKSDAWTPSLRQELGADDADGDDGSFWMCWDDFTTYFDEIGVCNPWLLAQHLGQSSSRSATTVSTVGCEWQPGVNAGGRPGFSVLSHTKSKTFRYNPTILLTTSQCDGTVHITLSQPDTRGKGSPPGKTLPWQDMYLSGPNHYGPCASGTSWSCLKRLPNRP